MGGVEQLAVSREPGAAEDDVECLPGTGSDRRVEQGRRLAIHRPGLAVGIGVGPEVVEDLNLVAAHHKNTAVAPVLPGACRRIWTGPLQMHLHVAERLAGLDPSRLRLDLEESIFHGPRCRRVAIGNPCLERVTAEEHHGICRNRCRPAGGLPRHDRRLGLRHGVLLPAPRRNRRRLIRLRNAGLQRRAQDRSQNQNRVDADRLHSAPTT